MFNFIKNKKTNTLGVLVMSAVIMMFMVSCDPSLDGYEYDLPEAGSFEDATPPEASFEAAQSVDDWMLYNFANLSTSATSYTWDFGDGNSSTTLDGVNTYPGEGTYSVTLTASDDLGIISTLTQVIEVIEPEEPAVIVPVILEHSFEAGSLPDGTGDGRDSWRNSDLGGVIQINTSSSVPDGGKAAKFPSAGDRIGYQELVVTANTDYTLTYTYRLENSGGSCTVAVLAGGSFSDLSVANAAAIESTTGSEESYTTENILFNSGANTVVSILITNQDQEARVDSFSIIANE